MTRHETFADARIAEKDFVLATDLDGTFLGGSDEDRAALIEGLRAEFAEFQRPDGLRIPCGVNLFTARKA